MFLALHISKLWQIFYLIKSKEKTSFFHPLEVPCVLVKLSNCKCGQNLILLEDQTTSSPQNHSYSMQNGEFIRDLALFEVSLYQARSTQQNQISVLVNELSCSSELRTNIATCAAHILSCQTKVKKQQLISKTKTKFDNYS